MARAQLAKGGQGGSAGAPTLGPRFEVVRRLGSGGMGVVYEVWDRERRLPAAAKVLRSLKPQHLVMFKAEFRSLQDVQHPNLVQLGELFEHQGRWFFTMELVRGTTVLRWARRLGEDGANATAPGSSTESEASALRGGTPVGSAAFDAPTVAAHLSVAPTMVSADELRGSTFPDGSVEPDAIVTSGWVDELALDRGTLDPERLRSALGQLGLGLLVLHRAGKAHRDVKPSNVLVDGDGRVVLLDFGLAANFAEDSRSSSGWVVGTPSYMAPEQASGAPVGPAADWYSVGVVLYQLLAGRLPFSGTPREMQFARLTSCPELPSSVDRSVPKDLEVLCLALLEPDPSARAGGAEVLRAAGVAESLCLRAAASSSRVPFVGRTAQLAELDAAYVDAATGSVVALVTGESGVGKSTLLASWLSPLRRRGEALVLASRCYEREAVPFKAVDGLMDSLARVLEGLTDDELAPILPRDAALIGRAFPALRALPAFALALPEPLEADGPWSHARRRLFGAMADLLGRLALYRRLVLVIDDFQWADADSEALLGSVLGAGRPPPLLLVLATRPREGLDAAAGLGVPKAAVRTIAVPGLEPAEARALAAAALGEGGAPAAASIAEEARGNPLFVLELARLGVEEGRPACRRVEDALGRRVGELDPDARRLLEVVTLAGEPLAQEVALSAARVAVDRAERVLACLKAERLVLAAAAEGGVTVEPYHNRVAVAVYERLPADGRAAVHRDLAAALESAGAGPETLFAHYRAAGDADRASRSAEAAAVASAESLAFAHAGRLFADAARLEGADGARRERLWVRAGEAFANAGRGADSARAFGAAAREEARATGRRPIDLERRAAEQLLRSGHVDEGLDLMSGVLAAVGLDLPPAGLLALPRYLTTRASLRVRGHELRPRAGGAPLEPRARERLDACWSAAVGLAMVDAFRSAELQSRLVVEAARAGDPYRLALGLALEAANGAAGGASTRAATDRVVREATRMAELSGEPHAVAMAIGTSGVAAYLQGRLAEALALCDRSAALFRAECVGAVWELDTVEIISDWSLAYLGRLGELQERVRTAHRDAEERDDRYAATNLMTGTLIALPLALDDPEAARRQNAAALARWSHRDFLHQHWDGMFAECEIDIYEGKGREALARLDARWGELGRAMVLMIQISRIEATFARGRAALVAAASTRGTRAALLRGRALADGLRLSTEPGPFRGLGPLLVACARAAAGDRRTARLALEAAVPRLEAGGLALHAAAARAGLGALIGGEEGRAARRTALSFMADRCGVKAPERYASALAPGFPVP